MRQQVKYYRVLAEYEGLRVGRGRYLIKNELLTQAEVVSLKVPMKSIRAVEVSQRRIYKMFGARFEAEDCHNTS